MDTTTSPFYTVLDTCEGSSYFHTEFKLSKPAQGNTTSQWLRKALVDIANRHLTFQERVKNVRFYLFDEKSSAGLGSGVLPIENRLAFYYTISLLALKFTVHSNTRPRKTIIKFVLMGEE